MLSQLSIPKKKTITAIDEATAPLDHEQLFAIGLQHVRNLASRIWNDYNVHDPGITTLELLAYAITDLSYRASFSIKDLLASASNNEVEMKKQFFTARQIFPNRALTVDDYRKLLIDIRGVQNAWIQPVSLTYYADTINGELLESRPPGVPGVVDVNVRGLYDVLIEFDDEVLGVNSVPMKFADAALLDCPDEETILTREWVLCQVAKRLAANRNLCEDFRFLKGVEAQRFTLCVELELSPDAVITEVHAQILFQVDEYLAPPVSQYTLAQMLAKTAPDGTLYTAERIFDGPVLDYGFIPDEELEASGLRTEIRLSDIISIIMDVPGVQAVRDIIFNPTGITTPLTNKWVIPVEAGKQALLDRDSWRLVSYKRAMPFTPDRQDVLDRWDALETTTVPALNADDFPIPLGTFRDLDDYYSFQNHYPEFYGIGPTGLRSGSDTKATALAYQLKGYLLFFDQIMANYFAQLNHVRDLFSADPAMQRTYFYQVVDSFREYQQVYGVAPGDVVTTIQTDIEDPDVLIERRNRFLDHLIARFAERFHDFVNVMYDECGVNSAAMIPFKCAFLADYPVTSSGRSMGYDYTLTSPDDLWDSENVSGLERRLAGLLGITDYTRRDLSDPAAGDGMYLIENILLRPDFPDHPADPFLPICPDPNCVECYDTDPYSYRIHIILPAFTPRFSDIDFRRWAEGVIREEVPAHIQPKVCWISEADMTTFEAIYEMWLNVKAGVVTTDRTLHLTSMIEELFRVKNIYPQESLHECTDPENEPRFILGRSALGTMPE